MAQLGIGRQMSPISTCVIKSSDLNRNACHYKKGYWWVQLPIVWLHKYSTYFDGKLLHIYMGILKLCNVGPQAPGVTYFSCNKQYIPST